MPIQARVAPARTSLASVCAPRHAVGLQRVSVCVCCAGAVSGDKIPIVAKKKTSERAATSGAGDGQSVTEQEIQHLILCRTVQPWGTLLAPPDPLEWEGLRRKRLFTRPTLRRPYWLFPNVIWGLLRKTRVNTYAIPIHAAVLLARNERAVYRSSYKSTTSLHAHVRPSPRMHAPARRAATA